MSKLNIPPALEAAYRSAPKPRLTRAALRRAIAMRRRREESRLRDDLVFGTLHQIGRLAIRYGGETPDALLEAIAVAVRASRNYDPGRCEFTTYVASAVAREFKASKATKRGHARPWEPLRAMEDGVEDGLSVRDGAGLEPDEIDELEARFRALPPLAQDVVRGLSEGKGLSRIAAEARSSVYRVKKCISNLRAIARNPEEFDKCLDSSWGPANRGIRSARSSRAMRLSS